MVFIFVVKDCTFNTYGVAAQTNNRIHDKKLLSGRRYEKLPDAERWHDVYTDNEEIFPRIWGEQITNSIPTSTNILKIADLFRFLSKTMYL